MHRGWVKQWRKEKESAIWNKPPLYYKVWRWLLMSVDHKTGTIKRSAPQIAEAVQWEENNAPKIPHRMTICRILDWLSEQEMIVTKRSGSSCHKHFEITVCNWEIYQNTNGELVTQENGSLCQRTDSVQELKEVQESTSSPSSVRSTTGNGEPPTGPRDILDTDPSNDWEPTDSNYERLSGYQWEKEIDLWDRTVKKLPPVFRFEAIEAFDRLNRYFKLSQRQINRLIQHLADDPEAKKFWGYAPKKLVTRSRDEMYVWQKIEHHMETARIGREENPLNELRETLEGRRKHS